MKEPHRFAIVGPVYPYRGGIAYFTTGLARELLSSGHNVKVISFSRQYPGWLYPGESDKDPSQEHASVTAEYLLDPLYPWTWINAALKIRSYQASVVFIQWWTTFWGPALFALAAWLRSHRIHCVFIVHNVMPHEAKFFDRSIAKNTLSRATACIALSPQEEARLHALAPEMTIYSGRLPIHRLSNDHVNRLEARQRLKIDGDRRVILFFGIVRPYKGLNVLLEALAHLARQNLHPLLIVAGEFWESVDQYREKVRGFGLGEQVKFDNRFIPNEEANLYFSAADVFVAPYLAGTQSGAVKVAMDYGLPVVASDRIASDLMDIPYSFDIFPAGDAHALAVCLRNVLMTPRSSESNLLESDGWSECIHLVEAIAGDVCDTN